jgi:hypothetical protein
MPDSDEFSLKVSLLAGVLLAVLLLVGRYFRVDPRVRPFPSFYLCNT